MADGAPSKTHFLDYFCFERSMFRNDNPSETSCTQELEILG